MVAARFKLKFLQVATGTVINRSCCIPSTYYMYVNLSTGKLNDQEEQMRRLKQRDWCIARSINSRCLGMRCMGNGSCAFRFNNAESTESSCASSRLLLSIGLLRQNRGAAVGRSSPSPSGSCQQEL